MVEVISGSRDKYEYNLDWEAFVLDRVLHSSVVFPVGYGFIPQTWFDDNDPLDIMIMTYEPTEVGCIIKARPIGVLIMEDEEGEDPKILSVPVKDPRFDDSRCSSP
ncbi:MAG: Inorganic pyrophosphatase [Candidatus Bathyarchaeota archaeon BA2]|nr:MAG: Inorganic pyrophosphatase [Candidatus Bathyarchaeota archaeon BA2]